MKRSKFNESQIAFILRQAKEGISVDESVGKLCSPSAPMRRNISFEQRRI